MGRLLIKDIVAATGGSLISAGRGEFSGVSIDSRTIKEGELFFALRGERFDGHDFLSEVLNTAGGAVVSAPQSAKFVAKGLVLVPDTLAALQSLGRYLRTRLRNAPVVGVTGTNGKTTTKEMISSVLGLRHKVLKTTGNLNNHIGLPLCLSRMDGDETAMVLEMGSDRPGDIRLLCDIALPDYAVVTNVGPAHLESFGSLEMVRQTDLEILGYVKRVFLNRDDRFLMDGTSGYSGEITTYGIGTGADVTACDIVPDGVGTRFRLCLAGGRKVDLRLNVPGRTNVCNALAAASVAEGLGMTEDEIRDGLEGFSGVSMRLEIRELAGSLFIIDAYNANPSSMDEALTELLRMRRNRSIAVLGDMLELGAYSEEAHARCVERVSSLGIDVLIAVGPRMRKAASGFSGMLMVADTSEEAGAGLAGILKEADTVLIKGSRGMRMERVVGRVEETADRGIAV